MHWIASTMRARFSGSFPDDRKRVAEAVPRKRPIERHALVTNSPGFVQHPSLAMG